MNAHQRRVRRRGTWLIDTEVYGDEHIVSVRRIGRLTGGVALRWPEQDPKVLADMLKKMSTAWQKEVERLFAVPAPVMAGPDRWHTSTGRLNVTQPARQDLPPRPDSPVRRIARNYHEQALAAMRGYHDEFAFFPRELLESRLRNRLEPPFVAVEFSILDFNRLEERLMARFVANEHEDARICDVFDVGITGTQLYGETRRAWLAMVRKAYDLPAQIDPHTLRAAAMYKVCYDEVTPEQRQQGKRSNYVRAYTSPYNPFPFTTSSKENPDA